MAYSRVDVRAFKIFHPWSHIPKICISDKRQYIFKAHKDIRGVDLIIGPPIYLLAAFIEIHDTMGLFAQPAHFGQQPTYNSHRAQAPKPMESVALTLSSPQEFVSDSNHNAIS